MFSKDERLNDIICAAFAIVAAIILASTTGLGLAGILLLVLLPKALKVFGRIWVKGRSKIERLRAQLAAAERTDQEQSS